MRQAHVPIGKMPKRDRRGYNRSFRKGWGGLSPVTKVMPDVKNKKRDRPGRRIDVEPPNGLLPARDDGRPGRAQAA